MAGARGPGFKKISMVVIYRYGMHAALRWLREKREMHHSASLLYSNVFSTLSDLTDIIHILTKYIVLE